MDKYICHKTQCEQITMNQRDSQKIGTKIKLGFVGCGSWARKKYLPYVLNRPDVNIIGLSDIVSQEEKSLIKKILPRVTIFDSYVDMCSSICLDGIVIALPHGLHFSATKYTLSKGIPTLVDKPLCPTHKQAKELINIARNQNITLAVSSQRRAQEGYFTVQKLVQNKKLGSILWIQSEFIHANVPNWENTWRNSPELAGERGVLLDTGYHLVDIILQILNNEEPDSFFVRLANRNRNVDMDAVAILGFPSGVQATIFVSRSTPTGIDIERLSILGTEGYALVEVLEIAGNKSSRISYSSHGQNHEISNFNPETKIYPLRDFLEHLQGNNLPSIWEASTTLLTLATIDKMYESAQNSL